MSSTIESLRQEIDKKYREALAALDVLAVYLADGAGSAGSTTPVSPKSVEHEKPEPKPTGSTVSVVVSALSGVAFKTVDELAEETKLSENEIRAVLYSKFVQRKIAKKKIGKKMAFRKRMPITTPAPKDAATVSSLVRNALQASTSGMTTAEVTASIKQEMEKIGGTAGAIGTALYNFKKRGIISHNEETGVYKLVSSSP